MTGDVYHWRCPAQHPTRSHDDAQAEAQWRLRCQEGATPDGAVHSTVQQRLQWHAQSEWDWLRAGPQRHSCHHHRHGRHRWRSQWGHATMHCCVMCDKQQRRTMLQRIQHQEPPHRAGQVCWQGASVWQPCSHAAEQQQLLLPQQERVSWGSATSWRVTSRHMCERGPAWRLGAVRLHPCHRTAGPTADGLCWTGQGG